MFLPNETAALEKEMMQIRSCTTWSKNGVRKRETHHSLYSHARTRTRVYTRSFMFFTVTSVTHSLNPYISTPCKNKHQIWTRKRFTSPLFLIVWQQNKRILQSNLPCSSAFFSSWSEWCDRCDSKKDNFPREYARAWGGRSPGVHQNRRVLTSQISITTQYKNFSSLFCGFFALWGNITAYTYRGYYVML